MAGPPVRVALLRPDPALAGRLAAVPGLVVAARPDATVMIAEAMPTEPNGTTPILVLAEGAAALAALRAGARAVLPRDAPADALGAALAALARGLVVLPPETLAALASREEAGLPTSHTGETPGLTRREREVLDLLAAGASNKVIARRLGLSFHTAKAHVAAVLQKLGAGSRADAVARGARAGLVLL